MSVSRPLSTSTSAGWRVTEVSTEQAYAIMALHCRITRQSRHFEAPSAGINAEPVTCAAVFQEQVPDGPARVSESSCGAGKLGSRRCRGLACSGEFRGDGHAHFIDEAA